MRDLNSFPADCPFIPCSSIPTELGWLWMATSSDSPPAARKTLRAALRSALTDGDVKQWIQALQDPLADPLAAITDAGELTSQLFDDTKYTDTVDWLTDVEAWSARQYRDPREPDNPPTRVLYETWAHIKNSLGPLLTAARMRSGFPERGGVLCFAGELKLCLVIEFQFHQAAPSLTPLTVVQDPKAAFAVWSSIEDQPPPRRDALRKMLVSGHKLIFHRGVLIHVDRRENRTVFGPSIDTLIMAELLAEDICNRGNSAEHPRSFLEIGTGSGMLTATALTGLPSLERIVGIELDFGSVSCTYRNLAIATRGLDPLANANCTLIAGSFDSARIAGDFDLVACNPPYLADLEAAPTGQDGGDDYLRAVGGRELIDQTLRDLDRLLSPRGSLLLMVNNMAVEIAKGMIPPGFEAEEALGPEGRPVLFEVEALYDRPGLLKQMQDNGDLRATGNAFEHTLHPLWIRRSTND